jgi:phenylacetic acid degradation operon negative regulatory protein
LTPSAERMLADGAERIFGFTSVAPEWDGQWLLVTARIPETDRSVRHHLRTRLSWAGLGSPAPGLWISTHTERAAEVDQVLCDAGVIDDARIFIARYRSGGEIAAMVAQAWDLDGIQDSYQDFMASFASSRCADPTARLVELSHYWRRFPGMDPSLPIELLPPTWSGARAAKLFARRHAGWLSAANEEWLRLNETRG